MCHNTTTMEFQLRADSTNAHVEFQLKARSHDTLHSLYDFAGDEVVSQATYSRVMTDGYMSTLSFVKGAAEGIGLGLDSETLERWKRVTNAAYYIDDFVDTAENLQEACELYRQGMDLAFGHTSSQLAELDELPVAMDDRLMPAVILLKNSVSKLPDGQVALLRHAATSINTITIRKAQSEDLAEYASLLKREAYYTSILVTGSASQAVYDQPAFARFSEWCEQTLTLGTLGDHAIDLHDDSRRHLTAVRPTVSAVGRLALGVVSPGWRMVTSRSLRRATLASLWERSQFHHTER